MVQTTVRINKQSLSAKMEKLKDLLGDSAEDKLRSLATYAVIISPVDTGAYVESMSVRPRGSSSGRMRTSNNKPTTPDKEAKKQEAIQMVNDDITSFKEQIVDSGGAVLINRAPHNKDVEHEHRVFERIKAKFR